MEADKPPEPALRKISHLPLLRFTSLATLFVALDSLLCVALWLAGGDSAYMEESVTDFSFTHSTFDLACLAVVRGVVLFACLYYLEYHMLMAASSSREDQQKSSRTIALVCQAGVLLLSAASFAYAVVKGGIIIHQIVGGTWNAGVDPDITMHITYKILCVVAVVFPAVEFGLGVASWWLLRRMMRVHRLRMILSGENDDDASGQPRRKADLRRLALLARPEYPLILLGILSLLVSSGGVAAAPYFFGKVINYALPNQTNCTKEELHLHNVTCTKYGIGRMSTQVVILVVVFFGASVAALFRETFFGVAGERFVARLRKDLFGTIIDQELGFFDKSRTGELTNRLSSDTQVVQNAVTNNINMLARYTLQMVFSVGLMFYLSAKLTAVLLSVVPLIAVSAVQYGRFLKKLRKEFQDKLAHANSTAEESISNVTTVRSFSCEPKMKQLYARDIDASYDLGRKLAFLSGAFSGAVGVMVYVSHQRCGS